jgi:hypothetical protein
MNAMKIQLSEARTAFEPGEELTGTASWKLDKPPRAVELRLFWFTRGQGSTDAGVAETARFDHPLPEEARPFRFRLPDGPCSFSGKLISLIWAVELVAEPSKETGRQEIAIAPSGEAVVLESLPETKPKKRWFQRRARP